MDKHFYYLLRSNRYIYYEHNKGMPLHLKLECLKGQL